MARMPTIVAAMVLTAVASPAGAQGRTAETPGAFAMGVAAGLSTFARDGVAVDAVDIAGSVELTLASPYFMRAQYAATPRRRLTLGIAHAFARIGRRAFLSSEGGMGWFAGKSGAYAGGGLQVPVGRSPVVVTGDVRLYITDIDLGIAAFTGLKVYFN